MSKGASFRYRQRTTEDVRRQMLIAGLASAIYAAHKDDAKALLAFLRSDLPLTHLEQHRAALADLIERRVQHKPHGQRGAAVPTRAGDMERYAIALCQSVLKRERKRCADTLPWGTLGAVMNTVRDRLEGDGDLIGVPINWDKVNHAVRRGTAFPDDWQCGTVEKDDAADIAGWDADRAVWEFGKFRDHHISAGNQRADWSAAWRKWCRDPSGAAINANRGHAK
jgi:hypothetical protein